MPDSHSEIDPLFQGTSLEDAYARLEAIAERYPYQFTARSRVWLPYGWIPLFDHLARVVDGLLVESRCGFRWTVVSDMHGLGRFEWIISSRAGPRFDPLRNRLLAAVVLAQTAARATCMGCGRAATWSGEIVGGEVMCARHQGCHASPASLRRRPARYASSPS
jgi:hypothetical protein